MVLNEALEAPVPRRFHIILTDEQVDALLIAAAVVRAEKGRLQKWPWPHVSEDSVTTAVDALHQARQVGSTPAWDTQPWEPRLSVRGKFGSGAEILLIETGANEVCLTVKYSCSSITCALSEANVVRVIAWMSEWLQRSVSSVRSGG
jgi:hypothetical protein